jgi:hypothetical protein
MAKVGIVGESSGLTDEDVRKRGLVRELIQNQTKVIGEFAKQLVTTAFTAIGVVVALKEKWLGATARPYQLLLLGIAIFLYLGGGLFAALAASAQLHRVSLSDYEDVDNEIGRVAKLRFRLTMVAFSLIALASLMLAIIAIVPHL